MANRVEVWLQPWQFLTAAEANVCYRINPPYQSIEAFGCLHTVHITAARK
jgi:hypothetical protein